MISANISIFFHQCYNVNAMKLNQQFIIPTYVQFVLDFLHNHNYEAFLVGGCVRDLLLDRSVHDFDITTNCLPDELLTIAKQDNITVVPTGLQHGTVTFIIDKEPVEVTTYRIEEDYLNHRKPSHVEFTPSLKEDLKRRDFTINALCIDNHKILDYFDGLQDLNNSIIRCIGDASERFNEDALRILRALRFKCVLNFTIEPQTYKAIQTNAHLLSSISKERIRDEFIKLLESDEDDLLLLLRDSYTLLEIIPEYELAFDVPQESRYHIYDVFDHMNAALNASKGAPLTLRLAILLHDLEKKNFKTMDTNNHAHFKGHAHASAKLSRVILNRLRFPKAIIKDVYTLIEYHDYYLQPKKKTIRKFLYKLQGNFTLAYQILEVQKFDNMGKNPDIIEEKNQVIDEVIALIQEMENNQEVYTIYGLNVDGNDMIQLGYQREEISIILQYLLKYIIHHQDKNTHEHLLKIAGGKFHEISNRQ